MNLNLRQKFEEVTERLGPVADLIPMIADAVKIGIAPELKQDLLARADEADEAADQLKVLTSVLRQALADDKLSLTESGELILALEKSVDELEDVVTGVDEDDSPPPVEP